MISAQEARQLERFALGPSAVIPAAGPRHARARGYGIEFQDYRRYHPGDDPRSIDWTVEARLRQLVVRVFRAEAHVRLHLLVDVSRSMTLGTPTKLACATKLAAALCYVAVERRDAVGVTTFDERVRRRVPPAAGRAQLFHLLEFLGTVTPGGRSAIDDVLVKVGGTTRGAGLVVVLSDFLGTASRHEGLRYLLYRGLTPAVVQVLADEDLDPEVADEVELVDAEDPGAPPLLVDAAAVGAYRARVRRDAADLRQFCVEHGLPWTQVTSSQAFDRVLRACLQCGLLASHA